MNPVLFCRIWIATVLLLVSASATVLPQDRLAYRVHMYVLTTDRESLSVSVARWADRNGGYFVERSFDAVTLRIPAAGIPDLRSAVEAEGGRILRFEPSASDLRRELDSVRAAISSREESLERILELMSTADIGATLDFERELRSLNGEIEYYRGQEQRILNDSAFAWVHMALTSEESSVPDFIPSAFEWINNVDLYRFLEDRS